MNNAQRDLQNTVGPGRRAGDARSWQGPQRHGEGLGCDHSRHRRPLRGWGGSAQVVIGAESLAGRYFTRISHLHSTCFYNGIASRTPVGGSVRRSTTSTTSSAWPQPVAVTSHLPRFRGAGPYAFHQPARVHIRTGSGRRTPQVDSSAGKLPGQPSPLFGQPRNG